MPFSATRKAPHAPAPVKTGERIAAKDSWPLFLWIPTPGNRFNAS